MTTICPWCFRSFDSQEDWAEQFENHHPILSKYDDYLSFLNTPRSTHEHETT